MFQCVCWFVYDEMDEMDETDEMINKGMIYITNEIVCAQHK